MSWMLPFATHTPLHHKHPLHHTCPPLPCMPPFATHTPIRPPVNRMTDAYENITMPQISFAGGNNTNYGNCGCAKKKSEADESL